MAPFSAPAGTSASVKFGPAAPAPAVPQGPDEPSTCTQSERLPGTDSSAPVASIMATLFTPYADPSMGRAARSANNPITPDSGMGALPATSDGGAAPPVPCDISTACTRNGLVLGGTAHVSVNWSLPALVKTTV